MMARDIMSTNVVSVRPETPVREIARTLLDHKISAVPVVDAEGRPMGIVSEGDLVIRSAGDIDEKREWWLSLLAEGEHLSDDFVNYVRTDVRDARQIMAAPVVTVAEDTDVAEIARLLSTYRIKRVPVLKHRRIVGIVSRADLVRAISQGVVPSRRERAAAQPSPEPESGPEPEAPAPPPESKGLNANHFRELIADHEVADALQRAEERKAEARRRHIEVSNLINHHVEDEDWKAILRQAQEAAAHGDTEFMILRFPSSLCPDGGRAINAPEPDWPASLRGEAAEMYLRWERDLKSAGFHLSARVLDFPGGMPGDIGLFLVWGR